MTAAPARPIDLAASAARRRRDHGHREYVRGYANGTQDGRVRGALFVLACDLLGLIVALAVYLAGLLRGWW